MYYKLYRKVILILGNIKSLFIILSMAAPKLLMPFISFPRNLNFKSFLRHESLSLIQVAKCSYEPPPKSFKDVVLPEQRKLTVIPKIPHYYINTKPPKLRKSHTYDLRGPERINNKLFHKQYGIVALSAGYLEYGSIEVIRNTVNREMDLRRMFAIWRVDPLWKPITKKGVGKRMGGGKPNVHHYASPVKAGRIVIEVGGKAEFEEVYPFLNRVAKKMPFDAIPISQEILEELEKEADDLHAKNINPFNFAYAARNNLQGCNIWTSPWDLIHHGEYI